MKLANGQREHKVLEGRRLPGPTWVAIAVVVLVLLQLMGSWNDPVADPLTDADPDRTTPEPLIPWDPDDPSDPYADSR